MKAEYRAKMCVDALKDLTTEQIEELKVWLKAESTTLMFDYVAKNSFKFSTNVIGCIAYRCCYALCF